MTGDDLIALKESLSNVNRSLSDCPSSDMDVAEYARCNGLTIDSCRDPWPACLGDVADDAGCLSATRASAEPGRLFELDGLQECLFGSIIPATERLHLPASCLKLLQRVCKSLTVAERSDLAAEMCFTDVTTHAKLKLDPPILRSDHEADCRQLTREINAFRQERFRNHRLASRGD